eukprot:6205634-Pleurochrysis_carterae.AAC.2
MCRLAASAVCLARELFSKRLAVVDRLRRRRWISQGNSQHLQCGAGEAGPNHTESSACTAVSPRLRAAARHAC